MEIINRGKFLEKKDFYFSEIEKGKIFIYPTDTIYGIGCDAKNKEAIERIREIKKRDRRPFSVIVPNKEWILENCFVSDEEELDVLPGKYTLILKLKNKEVVACESLIGGLDSIGVRIPDNWFARELGKAGIVFVTTSVNFSGEKPATSVEEIDKEILEKADYVIDSGILDGKPSKVVDLVKGKILRE